MNTVVGNVKGYKQCTCQLDFSAADIPVIDTSINWLLDIWQYALTMLSFSICLSTLWKDGKQWFLIQNTCNIFSRVNKQKVQAEENKIFLSDVSNLLQSKEVKSPGSSPLKFSNYCNWPGFCLVILINTIWSGFMLLSLSLFSLPYHPSLARSKVR